MKIQLKDQETYYEFDSPPSVRLLHSGLTSGLNLPYECASGTCGSCKARLVSGEIEDLWEEAPGRSHLGAPNEFLLCQCSATRDCVVEVSGNRRPLNCGRNLPVGGVGVITRSKILAPHVLSFSVELDRAIDFEAGQFVGLQFPEIPGFRSYSMVNHESGTKRLDFVVKQKIDGRLTPWLLSNAIDGRDVEWYGPLGSAVFHPDLHKNILCIAGGSGIAGMMSILSRAHRENYFTDFRGSVFFGIRTLQDGFYLSELNRLAAAFPETLGITIALSDEDVPHAEVAQYASLNFERGLVHEVAGKVMKGKYDNLIAYLAGPPPAVDASIRVLLLQGKLPVQSIRFDKFS